MNANTTPKTSDEEPEIGFEESIPLDGPDPVGEKMIDDLGRERTAGDSSSSKPESMPKQFPAS